MATGKSPATGSAGSELVITRVFKAPRDLVWQAWTEPETMKRWWGPKGFTAPVCRIDLRVGGVYHNCMRSPEGQDFWSTGIYREIVPSERLVCTDSFADAQGNVVPATHYGMSADFPLELLVTVTFEELDGQTRLTLKHVGLPPGKDLDDCRDGWSESFDKLAEVLAKA
ncbi:MAG TPA: SRPBCC domain-containing protein [Desulfuromonadales bacterium]|nr:SRPBCC domain-containing protein [Desulfuromonadales bacterium]